MNKKLITGILTVGLLLGGTTIAAANMNDNVNTTKNDGANAKTEVVKKKEGLISPEEAREIALSEHDGYVESIELEREHGYVYYEVDIENPDLDVYIDASTGEVLHVDWDDDDDRFENNNNQNLENIMSVEEAKGIAVAEVGGKVIEIELDEDDGRYEYDLELRTDRGEAEITIDAVTGEVLELEID
ncbi:PepSY domain-containing protein [Paucisalibacillus globulus]|uniref:PepSY domain-containing protein n=1 Tax=Paucisalibacillus globulus TaxID=351095 RepID=UPI00041FBCEC|nr:PepSY domain-containing protein [Paucisalibacillus globulus]